MEGFLRETRQKEVAVVQAEGDEALHKDISRVRREGGAEAVDVAKVEVGRAGDIIDVGSEGECCRG